MSTHKKTRSVVVSVDRRPRLRRLMCGGSREEQIAVHTHTHHFPAMSNLGGLSHHCGVGIASSGDWGMAGGSAEAAAGFGGAQVTGKRGCDDDSVLAKRARTGQFEMAAGEDQAMGVGVPMPVDSSGFWYSGDGCTAPQQQLQAQPSVYEQYLMKEQHLAEAAQRAQQATGGFKCPSGWSETEWDCCPTMPFAQVQNSDSPIALSNC